MALNAGADPPESALSTHQNLLIAQLPGRDGKRVRAGCEPVELVLGQVVCEPGDSMLHVHFPVNGFISLLAVDADSSCLEVGMIGREGMLGVHELLGVARAPTRALVQGAGMSLRMKTADFRAELNINTALRTVLLRYVHVCMQQLASSALCMRFHPLRSRLARWLLMTQDRAHAEHFHVTQEFLSSMLGVRRVGVTAAALALQEEGLIAYHRGDMQVRDRTGLEAASCSCYASDQQAYRVLLSAHRRQTRGP
jgi:CRP-like cAMP-binding protein